MSGCRSCLICVVLDLILCMASVGRAVGRMYCFCATLAVTVVQGPVAGRYVRCGCVVVAAARQVPLMEHIVAAVEVMVAHRYRANVVKKGLKFLRNRFASVATHGLEFLCNLAVTTTEENAVCSGRVELGSGVLRRNSGFILAFVRSLQVACCRAEHALRRDRQHTLFHRPPGKRS